MSGCTICGMGDGPCIRCGATYAAQYDTAWNEAIEAAALAIVDASEVAKECNCPSDMVEAIAGMADLTRTLHRPT